MLLGTSVASAMFLAFGALLLTLGFFSLGFSASIGTVVTLLAATVAAYVFIRVGRDIWRELRSQLSDGEKDGADGKGPEKDRTGPPASG